MRPKTEHLIRDQYGIVVAVRRVAMMLWCEKSGEAGPTSVRVEAGAIDGWDDVVESWRHADGRLTERRWQVKRQATPFKQDDVVALVDGLRTAPEIEIGHFAVSELVDVPEAAHLRHLRALCDRLRQGGAAEDVLASAYADERKWIDLLMADLQTSQSDLLATLTRLKVEILGDPEHLATETIRDFSRITTTDPEGLFARVHSFMARHPDGAIYYTCDYVRANILSPSFGARTPATTSTLPPSDLVESIATWLEAHYGREPARRGLLESAGVAADPKLSWRSTLSGLAAHTIRRILDVGGSSSETANFHEALDRCMGPVDYEGVLDATLTTQIQEASNLLTAERYADAERAYALVEEAAVRLANDSSRMRAIVARSRLNRAAALIGQNAYDDALHLLHEVEPTDLQPRGRVALGRYYAALGAPTEALGAISNVTEPGASVVRQLVDLHLGVVPPELADDADVQIRAARHLINERQAQSAVNLARRVLREPGLNRHGRASVAEVLVVALLQHWTDQTLDRLVDPGAVLEVLRGLIRNVPTTDADWADIRARHAACEHDLLALEAAPEVEVDVEVPPWAAPLEQAQQEPDSATALVALATKWPLVGPVVWLAGRVCLAAERPADSLDLARRAFGLLPGRGQGRLLVQALLAAGNPEEAAAVLAKLADDQSEDAWELRVRVAIATRRLESHSIADQWRAEHPTSTRPWCWLVYILLTEGDLRHARAAADKALDGASRLSVEGLQILAAAAMGAGGDVDHDLAKRIIDVLGPLALEDPDAELLRMQLLLATGAKDPRPPDWKFLVETGRAQPFSVDEAVALVRRRAGANLALDRAWAAGALAFEDWVHARHQPTGRVALAVQRGEIVVVPPTLMLDTTHQWRHARCLLGDLALEVLVALDLCDAFSDAVVSIVVFEDTFLRTMNGGMQVDEGPLRRELEYTDAIWSPLQDLPRVDLSTIPDAHTLLHEHDCKALYAWVAAAGLVPATTDAPWTPPKGQVVLTSGAMHECHRLEILERFVRLCERESVRLVVDERDAQHRRDRRSEIDLRIASSRLAARKFQWLGRVRVAGKLEVLPIPVPSPLPEVRGDRVESPWTRRVFAAREAMIADNELVLVTADFAELGVNGLGPAILLMDRAWTLERYREYAARYDGISSRALSLSQVVRELVSDDQREHALALMARAGYPDAYQPQDVVHLFERFGSLAATEVRSRMRGLTSSLTGAHRQAHHTLPAIRVGWGLLSSVIADAWLGERVHPSAERLTREVLDVAAQLDVDTVGRFRLVEQTIFGAALRSTMALARFFAPVEGDPHSVRMSDDTPGARMWACVGQWSRTQSRHRSAMDAALGAVIRGHAEHLGDHARGAVLATMISALPVPTSRPLVGHSLPALFNRQELSWLVSDCTIDGRNGAEWRSAAIRNADLCKRVSGVDLVIPIDGLDMHVPLEALVPEIGAGATGRVADAVGACDGGVRAALVRWASEQSPQALGELRHALDHSPGRSVRLDPTSILAWSRWADPVFPGPKSVAALRALLAEPGPLPQDRELVEVLGDRFGDGGVWSGDVGISLRTHFARIPGATITAGAVLDLDAELGAIAEAPDRVDHVPAGVLAGWVVALADAARVDPSRSIDDVQVDLGSLAARIAAAALGPSVDGSYSSLEPDLIRSCAAVVAAVEFMLPINEWIWLSWRLYGWWSVQLSESGVGLGAARAVARAAPPPADLDQCTGDIFDPRRAGPARVNLRELIVVQGIWAACMNGGRLDMTLLRPALQAVASRPLTPDERSLREVWKRSSLGGVPLVAPDVARLVLVTRDHGFLDGLTEEVRMRWLDDALAARSKDSSLALVSEQVLLAFALRPMIWSDAETARILSAVREPDCDLGSDARRVMLVAASSRVATDSPLVSDAQSAVDAVMSSDNDIAKVACTMWFWSCAARGCLAEAVSRTRAALQRRGFPEAPYLMLLAGVAAQGGDSVRAQVAAVLGGLTAEDALRSAEDDLGALLRALVAATEATTATGPSGVARPTPLMWARIRGWWAWMRSVCANVFGGRF